ncbi:MAG: hypothetical protein ACR2G6_06920 [Gemmatimonadaceae bacterium]
MPDEKEWISKDDTRDDPVGHGEWRGITPDGSDVPVQDPQDNAESEGVEGSVAGGDPADDLQPHDGAHDMSAELGLGYRDYGVGSAPAEEQPDE